MAMKENTTLRKKRVKFDWIDVVAHVFNIIFAVLILYPVLNTLARSFSGNYAIAANKVTIFPVDFTLKSYKYILDNPRILKSFANAIIYTAVGVTCNLAATVLMAYPLSKSKLLGRSIILKGMMFTMYFSGGMIPSYLLVSSLGLRDSMWALIIPNIIHTSNCIIMINGFRATPESLYEAAYLDGAGDFQVFVRIALPLAKATISVVTLYAIVGCWNEYFTAMIYLGDKTHLWPLQLHLRNLLVIANNVQVNDGSSTGNSTGGGAATTGTEGLEMMRYAMIIVSTVPILIAYGIVQKFFKGGVMVGSVKG